MTDAPRIPYDDALTVVRERVTTTLLRAAAPVSDVTRFLAERNGKGLRASLVLAAAAGPDNDVPENAVSAAAGIELLHLATLVHDDVVDDALTRRGKPSVQGKFGKKLAVLSGDYLFCQAFSMVAGLSQSYPGHFDDFTRAITRICLGEIDQLQHNWDADLTMGGYLRIIAGKTAALFFVSSYTGAILSGATDKSARIAGRFGYLFGMMFQILDDCLDYEDDGTQSRKTSNKDLAEGVITPPVIFAMARDPQLRKMIRQIGPDASEIRGILSTIVSLGGVKSSRILAARYHAKALAQLDRLEVAEQREKLLAVLSAAAGPMLIGAVDPAQSRLEVQAG